MLLGWLLDTGETQATYNRTPAVVCGQGMWCFGVIMWVAYGLFGWSWFGPSCIYHAGLFGGGDTAWFHNQLVGFLNLFVLCAIAGLPIRQFGYGLNVVKSTSGPRRSGRS